MLWLAVFRTYDLYYLFGPSGCWVWKLRHNNLRGVHTGYTGIYNTIIYRTYVLGVLYKIAYSTVYGYRHSSNRAQIIPRKTARSTSQASNFLVARSDPVFSGWVFTFILIASKITPSIQKTLLWDEYKCKTPSPKGLQKVRKEPPEAPLRCHERPPRLAFQRLEVGFP